MVVLGFEVSVVVVRSVVVVVVARVAEVVELVDELVLSLVGVSFVVGRLVLATGLISFFTGDLEPAARAQEVQSKSPQWPHRRVRQGRPLDPWGKACNHVCVPRIPPPALRRRTRQKKRTKRTK